MPFIVVEGDPFVRADISEALAEEFPSEDVAMLESVKELDGHRTRPSADTVLIVSTNEQETLPALPDPFGKSRTVFIVDHSELLIPAPDNQTYLQRPFSSATLIAAVRTVLSDPPEGRS